MDSIPKNVKIYAHKSMQEQLRSDGVNHYYENTNRMWHGMNAEHVI